MASAKAARLAEEFRGAVSDKCDTAISGARHFDLAQTTGVMAAVEWPSLQAPPPAVGRAP